MPYKDKNKEKEYKKQYRLDHIDEIKENQRLSYQKNKEKYKERNRKDYYENPEKGRAKSRKWYKNNCEQSKKYSRMYRIRQYGISIQEYNIMFEKQKGCCLICGRHQSDLKVTLGVDHDHITGEVRGLLCNNCNTKLGWFETFKNEIMQYLKIYEYRECDCKQLHR